MVRLFPSSEFRCAASSLPLEDPEVHNPDLAKELDLLGVSVHHFVNVFLPDILKEFPADAKFLDIENLYKTAGYVRRKGAGHVCPLDGQPGAAYVHTLSGQDHVGPSTAMLSWTWQYTVSDVVHTLNDYCEEHRYNPKRTYIWICCLW